MRIPIRKLSGGSAQKPVTAPIATAATACLAGLAAVLALTGVAVSAASRPMNYCQAIPFVTVKPEMWGFHAGHAITGPTGTYARGHGHANLSTGTANGVICQVNRPRHRRDREIILSVGPRFNFASHYATKWGVPGNILQLKVRVKHSTDPKCRVGTPGKVTIFASYNGVHRDSVQFFFPVACSRAPSFIHGL